MTESNQTVWKQPAVIAAAIAAVASVIVGYWQYRPTPRKVVRLAVLTLDSKSKKAIPNAIIILQRGATRVPKVGDGWGIASFDFSANSRGEPLRVLGNAPGYQDNSLDLNAPEEDATQELLLDPTKELPSPSTRLSPSKVNDPTLVQPTRPPVAPKKNNIEATSREITGDSLLEAAIIIAAGLNNPKEFSARAKNVGRTEADFRASEMDAVEGKWAAANSEWRAALEKSDDPVLISRVTDKLSGSGITCQEDSVCVSNGGNENRAFGKGYTFRAPKFPKLLE